jgi:hypothetical protein
VSNVHTGGVKCGVFCWQVRLGTLGEVVRVNSKSTFAIAVVAVLVGCTVGPSVSKYGALTLDCIAISRVERWRALTPYLNDTTTLRRGSVKRGGKRERRCNLPSTKVGVPNGYEISEKCRSLLRRAATDTSNRPTTPAG